jgi:hypothetical protein
MHVHVTSHALMRAKQRCRFKPNRARADAKSAVVNNLKKLDDYGPVKVRGDCAEWVVKKEKGSSYRVITCYGF